jgi:2',3'-cyclic-nucleotide 2'-phosphodiesterase (5'-nucleotidase family)
MRRNPTILAAAVASLLAMIALTWTPGCSTAAPAQLSATSTPAVKAAASGSTGAASPTGSAADSVHITILHINDSHGHTEPYMLGGKSVGGYARVATMADEARAAGKAARVFLVHAGDEFSRGDDLTRASLGAANVAIMNQLKFDLWVPGNGEFYDGVPVLKARLAESKATVLAANVKIKAADEAIARPYVIEQAGPVRIAFLGLCFLQPLDASFDSYKVAEPLAMARELVPLLRKQADVVILVTHLGAPSDKRLAETVPGIDVILGAHTHNAFPDGNHYKSPEGRDVLTCMAGEHLEYLGKVDLDLARTAGGWQLTSATDVLIPIDGKVKMDPTVTALIAHLAEKYIKPAKSTPSKSAPAPKSPPAAAPVPRG